MRRQKTYAAASGYVYQYFYLGHRAFRTRTARGTEYVFEVTSDRRVFRPVSILLAEIPLAGWEARHGRALVGAERYAIAKMTLFQAFDERAEVAGELLVRPADVEAILETLGIE